LRFRRSLDEELEDEELEDDDALEDDDDALDDDDNALGTETICDASDATATGTGA
jgi:hypothetical protein